MSSLHDNMKAKKTEQKLQDRVAETLNIFHDLAPLQPTATALTKQGYDTNTDVERDISMITNIPSEMVYTVGLEKALAITSPCPARSLFTEAILRASRSKKGWGIEKTIEALKGIRPVAEEEVQRGRLRRFADWVKGG